MKALIADLESNPPLEGAGDISSHGTCGAQAGIAVAAFVVAPDNLIQDRAICEFRASVAKQRCSAMRSR